MKRDIPTQAGIGFTIFVAAATFAIAVVAGIFLIYQPETNFGSNAQSRALAQAQMSLADAPGARRGLRAAPSAPVEDRAGHRVGHFRHLTFQDGREEAVITLHNNKTIVLDDEHLRFDPVKDVVVADLSFNELNRLPARF